MQVPMKNYLLKKNLYFFKFEDRCDKLKKKKRNSKDKSDFRLTLVQEL